MEVGLFVTDQGLVVSASGYVIWLCDMRECVRYCIIMFAVVVANRKRVSPAGPYFYACSVNVRITENRVLLKWLWYVAAIRIGDEL